MQTSLLLSGGIDSAVCASLLTKSKKQTNCLFIDYGQPVAGAELQAAIKIANFFSLPLGTVKVQASRKFGAGEIIGRNLALISLAALTLEDTPAAIAIGIHAGTSYFDCSSKFVAQASQLIRDCSGGRLEVIAPLMTWTKAEIVHHARELRLPLEDTFSCEQGPLEPCGQCLSCKDRESLNC